MKISFQLQGWNEKVISAHNRNWIYQLKWKFRFFAWPTLREKMNLWSPEPANSPYKYTVLAPAESVGLADARLAVQEWKSATDMEFLFQASSWHGIFISAQQLIWKFDKIIGRAARPLPLSFKGFLWASRITRVHNTTTERGHKPLACGVIWLMLRTNKQYIRRNRMILVDTSIQEADKTIALRPCLLLNVNQSQGEWACMPSCAVRVQPQCQHGQR